MPEEDILFRRTTWGGNGKADLKGKGKANLNNAEGRPKVCLSVHPSISS